MQTQTSFRPPREERDRLLPAVAAIRELLGCGTFKARAHLRSGAVKAVLAGNKIMISESELARLKASLPEYSFSNRKAA